MRHANEIHETDVVHVPESTRSTPKDTFNIAYISYFILGFGFLLPWNSFITAVDYFSYLYPSSNVDRVFSVAYLLVGLVCLPIIIWNSHKSSAYVRINIGLGLFVVSLLVVPLLDAFYVKGRVGVQRGFYVTVASMGLSGLANALVEGGIVGAAGQMPERYVQAVVSGTAASGVLISLLRILTKALYPHDPSGLRKGANLYFGVGIVVMILCIVLYNVAERFPIIKYYKELQTRAVNGDEDGRGPLTQASRKADLFKIVKIIKWYGIGIIIILASTLIIFPGYVTEDVHSRILKDWYPILLITAFNVFDLIGKSLTALYLMKNARIAIGFCFARMLFIPLFYACLHGPMFLRGEIPVTTLTSLFAVTNGYLTSILMILIPKAVPLQHAETAGTVAILFQTVGLATGSIVAWFWVV